MDNHWQINFLLHKANNFFLVLLITVCKYHKNGILHISQGTTSQIGLYEATLNTEYLHLDMLTIKQVIIMYYLQFSSNACHQGKQYAIAISLITTALLILASIELCLLAT